MKPAQAWDVNARLAGDSLQLLGKEREAMTGDGGSRHFDYEYDPRLAPMWLPFRAWPGRQGVTLTEDGRLVARYGPFRVDKPLEHVRGAHVTGPYRWWTAVGPRLSMVDDGLTFGTNATAGVCIHFDPPAHRVLGLRDHSALTVTVADPVGLVAALENDRRTGA
jgi:hypothetical protein